MTETPRTPAPRPPLVAHRHKVWSRLAHDPTTAAAGAVFLAVCAFSFCGPPVASSVAGLDSTTQDTALGAAPPSWAHLMGTDTLGRDMMLRTMEGGQIAIVVGVVATLVAVAIGVTWGAVSAYVGGAVDEVMMRVVDILYAFPVVVFAIVVMTVLESRSLFALFALIGAVSWLDMARIVRGQVLGLRNREFVEAARSMGVSSARILLRHVVPSTLDPVIVYATMSVSGVMLTEAFLSFLGIGVQAPRASWGTLITEGVSQLAVYPWTLIGPGLVMGMTIFALNLLGDGLRDALSPHGRGSSPGAWPGHGTRAQGAR